MTPSTATTGVGSMSVPRTGVVEADVAADDGDLEGQARLGHAVDGLRQLPHHLGVLGVAEVEAVDEGHGPGPGAGHVERRLGHGHGRARRGSSAHQRGLESVEMARPRSLGGRPGRGQAQHGGVLPRARPRC